MPLSSPRRHLETPVLETSGWPSDVAMAIRRTVQEAERDFFVSYTSADRPWAEWIAWELEAAGYSALIQAWDMQPGSSFVHEMHEATRSGTRPIAVLSPAFLASEFCEAEWGAAFRTDPVGRGRQLIPVRVRACDPD